MLKFDKSKLKSQKTGDVITLTYEDENAYKNGTDIPFKTLKEVDDYRADYLKAVTAFSAEEAKETLKKDKTASKVIVQFPYTSFKRGEANIIVDRSKTFPGIGDRESVTKSKITVVVKDPLNKVPKSTIHSLEADLTAILVK